MSAANFLRNARSLIGAMLRQDPALFRRNMSADAAMRLPNAPRVPVRYDDHKRWPREFCFQNPASFLLSSTDMQGGATRRRPLSSTSARMKAAGAFSSTP